MLTKEQVEPDRLRGAAALVIDVLLATTTVVARLIQQGLGDAVAFAAEAGASPVVVEVREGWAQVLRGSWTKADNTGGP